MNIIEKTYKWNGVIVYMSELNVKYLIYHHAAAVSCTADDIHRWHLNNGWKGIGYNYFVAKDGKVYRGRPEMAEGGHTEGYNTKGIAICAEGNYSVESVMPEAQKQAIIELSKDILSRHPHLKIVGHRDLNATACPGNNFPMDEIVAAVTAKDVIATDTKKLYRIRMKWDKPATQQGAYANLENAKKVCPVGYTVFDWNGAAVYSNEVKVAPAAPVKRNFVKEAQEYLNRNYSAGLVTDGIWGPKTSSAVLKVLQRAVGAVADGIWGPETYSKCGTVGNGDSGSLVVVLQLLSAKFSDSLEVDGIFGNKTHEWVIRMQKRYGLTPDGLAGRNTFKTLYDI